MSKYHCEECGVPLRRAFMTVERDDDGILTNETILCRRCAVLAMRSTNDIRLYMHAQPGEEVDWIPAKVIDGRQIWRDE